jgi:putative lipoic acid-binding regulatory protein
MLNGNDMSNMPLQDESLIQFPCDFPIKIMGEQREDFAQNILAIVIEHAPDFSSERMEMRVSSGGRYVSLTCTVYAKSRAQLDALYSALSSHPSVRVVL